MASDILADLDISRDLLDIFEQCDIGLYELLTLSLQDLKEYLEQTGVNWSYENLFERITSWRKRNKTQIAQLLLSGSSLQEPPEAAASSSLPKADEHFEIVTEIILHPESQPEEEQESQPEEEQGESQQEEKEELREKSTDVENSQPEPLAEERVQSPSDQLDTSQSEKTNTVAEDVNKHSSPSVQSFPDQQSRPDTSRLITLNPEWLNGLLLSSEKGKDILRRSEHGELSEPKQQQLAEIVANYHISLHRNLRSEDLENYSLAITTLFKSEKKESYYIPRGGDRKNPGGKIANKIGNLKQKKRKEEAREDEHVKKLKPSSAPQKVQAVNEGTQWLILNVQPWSTVLDKWPVSFSFRQPLLQKQKSAAKLLQKFPHYKEEFGYQLIDKDFASIYPEAPTELDKLKEVCNAARPFIEKQATDPSASALLKHFDSTSEDTRICAFLLALNTVLPPISAGYRYKPTISVAQEDTVVFARNEEDAASKIQTIYSAYAERSLPVVPKLVVFGDDLNRMIGRFFVYCGDIQYELPSAARALDVLIKFTAVLGLPYSKQSKLVWYSISDIVYRIPQRELYASCVKLRKNLTADSSS